MKKGFSTFPERLKFLRNEEQQGVFAAKLGLKQGSYSRYETGEREPKLEILCQIAKATGVSADWLLGLTDGPAPGVTVTATGSSVAANHSTVSTGGGGLDAEERSRLLGIIESQQSVIASLAGKGR